MRDRGQSAVLRVATYRLLAGEGLTAAQAAKRLKVTKDTVLYHARALLEIGVIKEQQGRRGDRRLKFYEKGAAAPAFEAAQKGDQTDRGVRLAHRTPVRIHNGHVAVRVLQAPDDPETLRGHYKTTTPSGVRNYSYRWRSEDGGTWKARFSAGRSKQSITVYPPAYWTNDPDEVASAPEWWPRRLLGEALRHFEPQGFVLQRDDRDLKTTGQQEFGTPVKTGKPKGQPTPGGWADGSPGGSWKGVLEYETASAEAAAAFQRQPYVEAAQNARLDYLEESLADLGVAVEMQEAHQDRRDAALAKLVGLVARSQEEHGRLAGSVDALAAVAAQAAKASAVGHVEAAPDPSVASDAGGMFG